MAESTVPVTDGQGKEVATQQEGTRAQEQYQPALVDIYETGDGLTVIADLPGVSKDNLDIQVKNNILTIQGRTRHGMPGHVIYRDFQLLHFFREFRLPDQVDVNRIQADLKHGVLTLRLPKAEEAKPRKINVEVGGC